ncbi:MAG: hypothetical protein GY798_04530 [Hyphomicrobiales bacterium]|nr:hypothetical protein [Hyphomicrobiales bacterium]
MAEYYTVLKRAVVGVDPNVPDARRAVYDKARNALIGQLKAVDPPLTTGEISRQRLELEEAIRRVERETAAGQTTPPPQQPGAAVPPPPVAQPPMMAAPESPPVDDPSPAPAPQDVFRRAIREAGIRGGGGAPAAERPPVAARADAARHNATAPDLGRPAADENPLAAPPRRAPPAAAPAYSRAEAAPREAYDAEPRLAPEYDQDWEGAPPQGRAPSPSPRGPEVDGRDRLAFAQQARGRGYVANDEGDLVDPQPRRSRLPGIILTVLIVAVVAGIAALGYSQRDFLMDMIASFESGQEPVVESPPVESAAVASTKNADRLLAGGEEAAAPDLPPAPDRDVRVVGDEPDAGPGVGPDVAAVSSDSEPLPLPGAADDAASSAGTIGVQKAILYEEPVGATEDAELVGIDGEVTWQYVDSGPNGPEVQAVLNVPGRGAVRLGLHRNADETLPASHLVQVTVDTPASFPGGGINEIPSIVLKPSEGDRGQQLVGAALKVADGFFWIALSANQNDIATNLALLRTKDWIDLPFVYANGQRALLTFEKGSAGEQVFETALSAWGGG